LLWQYPASKTLVDIEVLDKADMTIKVTGIQWKWQYDYPEEGISFVSNLAQSSRDVIKASPEEREAVHNESDYLRSVDNHLVLPVDTTVRFLITSNDVIHNWWVPAFGVKQDANLVLLMMLGQNLMKLELIEDSALSFVEKIMALCQ
jgi:cytochrome c oxidase subunit 2